MGCTKRVVDEQVASRCEFLRELRAVGSLARIEAHVLAQAKRCGGIVECDLDSERGRCCYGDALKRERGINPVRTPQMRAEDNALRSCLAEQRNGGRGPPNSRVVGNATVFERHVEINADKYGLPRDVGAAHATWPMQRHGLEFEQAA